jgi:hypothetical protein
MKSISLKVMLLGLLSATFVLAATAATPKWIGDRIVDKIMEWGDKHVKGPFKKGGGDEATTRAVVSAVVMPGKAWKTAIDLTFNNGSQTASPDQDTPGYSQQHGVPIPPGSSQGSIGGPSGQPHEGGVGSQHDPTGRTGMVSGGTASGLSGNSNASAQNDSGAGASQPHSNQTWLRAGENNWAQPNKETTFNPNPEVATGGKSAPSNPAPAAQPAPSPAPAPAQHDHQGAFGHDGGGHQGNYGGPDGHSSQVDHAGHIS